MATFLPNIYGDRPALVGVLTRTESDHYRMEVREGTPLDAPCVLLDPYAVEDMRAMSKEHLSQHLKRLYWSRLGKLKLCK